MQETLIDSNGYNSEAFEVETQDGYLLKVHRVKPKRKAEKLLRPVLIMHGMFATSGDFVVRGADSLRKLIKVRAGKKSNYCSSFPNG